MENNDTNPGLSGLMNRSNALTTQHFAEAWTRNSRVNYANKNSFKKIQNYKLDPNRTPFVCGAGPSLTEHIPFIRENRDKLLLIAVDAAFSVLYKEDIFPDITVNIDASCEAFIPCFAFANYSKFQGVMFAASVSSPEMLEVWRNHIYLYNLRDRNNPLLTKIEQVLLPQFGGMDSRFNVGEFCLNMVIKYFGYKAVGFTGIDLAYLNNKYYADGVGHAIVPPEDADGTIYIYNNDRELVPTCNVFLVYQAAFLKNYLYEYARRARIYNLSRGILPLRYNKEGFIQELAGTPTYYNPNFKKYQWLYGKI